MKTIPLLHPLKRLRTVVVTFLIILQPLTFCYMNSPAWVSPLMDRFLLGKRVEAYARLVGLESRWQMYSELPVFNWWFVIQARYADGALVLLPLPRQSPRTFWQCQLFDLKEAKFHHGLLSDPIAKQAYSRYLCRTYSNHDTAAISEIVWATQWQNILDPNDTHRRGTHLDPAIHSTTETYPCASSPEPPLR